MNVEFLGSFVGTSLPRHTYGEVAVGGRSNVGKSSFINAILGARGVARVSSTPGRTRTINLYLCDRRLVLADLPGYGYSRAPKKEKGRWVRDVEHYFAHRDNLKAVIQLIDIRHFPMAVDLDAVDWLVTLGKPFLVVFTKADKLKRSQLTQSERDISGMWPGHRVDCVTFSAKTGLGRKDVWSWIEKAAVP
jgi:GTP-binding protein